MANRSKDEVLAYLARAEVGAVGTSNLGAPRLRMMHFAADEAFNIYLTSMKGDPKITQWLNVPQTALLIHQGATFMEMEECEVIGRAEIVADAGRERAVELLRHRSPIVAQMERQGALDRLEFIRVRPHSVKYRFVPEILQGQPPTVFEFRENQERSSAWDDLLAKARAYRTAIRPLSLTASLVSVLLGGALALSAMGALDLGLFALTLIAALLVQVGTNMINDWKDAERDGENRAALRPFSGGSRVIQLGLVSRAEMGFWGLALSLVAAVIGVYLLVVSGWGLLPLILYGLAAGVFYTAAEGRFSFINLAPGVGEALIATTYGVGITLGTYFVQTGAYSWFARGAAGHERPAHQLVRRRRVRLQDAQADPGGAPRHAPRQERAAGGFRTRVRLGGGPAAAGLGAIRRLRHFPLAAVRGAGGALRAALPRRQRRRPGAQ